MDNSSMFEPFEPVTFMDCPSPEPPEATADAPSPEATADPPPSVLDVVIYRPFWVDMHMMIGNLITAAAWANTRAHHNFGSVPQTRPLAGGLDVTPAPMPWLAMPPVQTPIASLTDSRTTEDWVRGVASPDFAAAWNNILRRAGIIQETNFADESRTLDVVCPVLPPGPARFDRPARRE